MHKSCKLYSRYKILIRIFFIYYNFQTCELECHNFQNSSSIDVNLKIEIFCFFKFLQKKEYLSLSNVKNVNDHVNKKD